MDKLCSNSCVEFIEGDFFSEYKLFPNYPFYKYDEVPMMVEMATIPIFILENGDFSLFSKDFDCSKPFARNPQLPKTNTSQINVNMQEVKNREEKNVDQNLNLPDEIIITSKLLGCD